MAAIITKTHAVNGDIITVGFNIDLIDTQRLYSMTIKIKSIKSSYKWKCYFSHKGMCDALRDLSLNVDNVLNAAYIDGFYIELAIIYALALTLIAQAHISVIPRIYCCRSYCEQRDYFFNHTNPQSRQTIIKK